MNIWSEYKKKVIGLRKFLLRNVTNTTGDPIEWEEIRLAW